MNSSRMSFVVVLFAFSLTSPARGQEIRPVPSFHYLPTGNGHGFQVYNAEESKIVSFLERPYRYLRPGPTKEGEGVVRRDLAFDVYFGVRAERRRTRTSSRRSGSRATPW